MASLKTASLETEKKVGGGKDGLVSAGEVGTLLSPGLHLLITSSSYLIPRPSPPGLLPASGSLTETALSLKFLAVYVALRT